MEAASKDEEGKNCPRHERSYQGFLRTLGLPEDAVKDNISERCQDRVLTLEIPKEDPEPERRISVD